MATFSLDKSHSELEFKVRHMMISTVKGQFKDFDVVLDSDSEDLSDAKVSVRIDVKSIDTSNAQRDEHLRSADFFNVDEFASIEFNSTSIEKKSSSDFKVVGDLTIKGVTKSISLDAEFGGVAKDPWGNAKVGYTVSGVVNRMDFDLTWNAVLETGGVMVSEDIKFVAEVQFVKS